MVAAAFLARPSRRLVLVAMVGTIPLSIVADGVFGDIPYLIVTGMVIVADGTQKAAERLTRVLTTDPGTGIVRHADAGYEQAIQAAKRHGIKMPMLK